MVKFAYIPKAELRIHAESQERRERSPDYAQYSSQPGSGADDDEHVLVLDLQENSRGKKSANPGFVLFLPQGESTDSMLGSCMRSPRP